MFEAIHTETPTEATTSIRIKRTDLVDARRLQHEISHAAESLTTLIAQARKSGLWVFVNVHTSADHEPECEFRYATEINAVVLGHPDLLKTATER